MLSGTDQVPECLFDARTAIILAPLFERTFQQREQTVKQYKTHLFLVAYDDMPKIR